MTSLGQIWKIGVGWGFTILLDGQTQRTFCTYFPHLKSHSLTLGGGYKMQYRDDVS